MQKNPSKDNYTLLIDKLDQFIRKYYVNQLIKGSLYSLAIILVSFLFIALAEYNFFFSSFVRKLIFYSFIFTSISAIGFFVLQPLFKIYKLGKIINHEQAAQIIGNHFSNVEDKLLNILQLKTASTSLQDASLIQASIEQKSLELKPVPFTSAINLSENKNYLKFALPPFLILLLLLFIKPNIIKDSTDRLVRNNIQFERPMPFQFLIEVDSLKAIQFSDFKVNIKLEGEDLPSEVYIVKNNIKTKAQKLNNSNYAYVFTNLQNDVGFLIEGGGFKSRQYKLEVLAKPILTDFSISITYPNYLDRKQEVIKNSGDITVPFGSAVNWKFDTKATDKIFMEFSDTLIALNSDKKNQFYLNKILKNSDLYKVKIINKSTSLVDSSEFSISVIPDEYPQISVQEYQDSINQDIFYYIGEISDDYGLTALNFNYRIEREGEQGNNQKYETINIPFSKGVVSEFNYYWNINQFKLRPGDRIDYFFQIWDNDGVNGRKSSRSKWMSKSIPSADEMQDESKQELETIKEDLAKTIERSKDANKEAKDIQEKLFEKKELSWDDKKKIEDFLQEQKDIENSINSLEQKLQKNMDKQSKFKEVNPEIKKKQDQLQKLFDEILDEETKALMEKLEKMMEELSKDKAMEMMKEMELSDEQLEKELDRMLELLKKLEFEQKLDETISKLDELSKEQEELAEQTENKEATNEDLKEKQDKLNEKFDKLKDDLDALQKMSDDLNKEALEELDDLADDTADELQDASEELDNNNNKKAGEKQKQGAQQMQEMAKSLKGMKSQMDMEEMMEDMASLRRLLENLVKLSFAQEDLLEEFKTTTINTPKYLSLIQDQFKLEDDFKVVEDSLFALAKRVFEIESFITDEVASIKRNLSKSVELLAERKTNQSLVNQQYSMTGFNNLALMLSEVMEQMQQSMAQQMEGNQMCQNPGNKPGSKPGKIPGLKQLQQQLNDQISQMSEMMKEGSSPKGKEGMSQKMAEMAAKQQQIRKALEEINNSDNKDGKGSLGNLKEVMDQMDKTETDLVNKELTEEMIKRQQEIMVRLLEAENAEKQRDEKEERLSNTADQFVNETPPSLEEYLKKKEASLDYYKALPPVLKPYYRKIAEKYFRNVSINE